MHTQGSGCVRRRLCLLQQFLDSQVLFMSNAVAGDMLHVMDFELIGVRRRKADVSGLLPGDCPAHQLPSAPLHGQHPVRLCMPWDAQMQMLQAVSQVRG